MNKITSATAFGNRSLAKNKKAITATCINTLLVIISRYYINSYNITLLYQYNCFRYLS